MSALCALCDGLNPNPHPRGKGLKALMERLRIEWAAEKRRTFEHRAINSLNDGYTMEQAGWLCAIVLRDGTEDGRHISVDIDILDPAFAPGICCLFRLEILF